MLKVREVIVCGFHGVGILEIKETVQWASYLGALNSLYCIQVDQITNGTHWGLHRRGLQEYLSMTLDFRHDLGLLLRVTLVLLGLLRFLGLLLRLLFLLLLGRIRSPLSKLEKVLFKLLPIVIV